MEHLQGLPAANMSGEEQRAVSRAILQRTEVREALSQHCGEGEESLAMSRLIDEILGCLDATSLFALCKVRPSGLQCRQVFVCLNGEDVHGAEC